MPKEDCRGCGGSGDLYDGSNPEPYAVCRACHGSGWQYVGAQ